jgi:hypothetical protein
MSLAMIPRSLVVVLALATPALAQISGVSDAERFAIDWTVERRDTCAWVTGYVANRTGKAVTNVRLLIEELDESGRVVDAAVAFVSPDLTPSGRGAFRAAVAGTGATYRVTIRSYSGVRGR